MSDATGQPMRLRVDIVSDVVCPWCIIGYRQLMSAVAASGGAFQAQCYWHPFELNPQMPAEGQNLQEHIAQKYGTDRSGGSRARDRLTALGDALGFRFDYHDEMRMVNTFQAHQLLHWAGIAGDQTALALALFEAFFTRREDVSCPGQLVRVVARAGLDADEAAAVLDDGRYADNVREEQQVWRDRDVYAVPTFYFQQQYMVPGAQEADTFVRLLHKIRQREVEGPTDGKGNHSIHAH